MKGSVCLQFGRRKPEHIRKFRGCRYLFETHAQVVVAVKKNAARALRQIVHHVTIRMRAFAAVSDPRLFRRRCAGRDPARDDHPSGNILLLFRQNEAANTGGSLTINYTPSSDSTPIAAQFSGPVTLSGSASLSVHTLQVDAAQTFTLSGGTLAFNVINLMPDSTTPAKLAVSGNMNFSAFSGSTSSVTNGAGSSSSGWVDLGGATRALYVASGVGLFMEVPIANGGLTKSGAGTMHLDAVNTYTGGTTLSAGTLEAGGSGSIQGNVTNSVGTLKLDNASAMASSASLALASSPASGAVNLNFSGT